MKRAAGLAVLLLASACVSRPPLNRGWATHEQVGAAMLTYGVPDSDDIDLFAVCDQEAKVFELAFFTGDTSGNIKPGTRTEMLVGPSANVASLMAVIEYSEISGEMMVVARTGLPPRMIAGWAGERVTVAAEGMAITMLARPDRKMIETFLARCG